MPIHHLQATPNPGIVLPEVFSARELAEAAGVPPTLVRQLIIAAEIPTLDGELVAHNDAVAAVQALRRGRLQAPPIGMPPGVFGSSLSSRAGLDPQSRNVSVLMLTGLHTMVALLVALLTNTTLTTASDDSLLLEPPRLARLVFVAEPGPGGGGLRTPVPSPRAERKGASTISSQVPTRLKPRRVEPVETPEPPPPLDNEPLPPDLRSAHRGQG